MIMIMLALKCVMEGWKARAAWFRGLAEELVLPRNIGLVSFHLRIVDRKDTAEWKEMFRI
jgi:hypothetical protein